MQAQRGVKNYQMIGFLAFESPELYPEVLGKKNFIIVYFDPKIEIYYDYIYL